MHDCSKGTLTAGNVMRELSGVVDWYSLGLELNLPKEEVEKHGDFEMGGKDMICQWLKMKGEGATWKSLAAALARAGEKDSADEISKVTCNSVQLTA